MSTGCAGRRRLPCIYLTCEGGGCEGGREGGREGLDALLLFIHLLSIFFEF